jgi:hypothetical protein
MPNRSASLDPRYAAIPIVGVGSACGLATSRRRRPADGATACATALHTGRAVKAGGKTEGSARAIPMRTVVLGALDAMPLRIDTPILFPAPRGGYI